MPTPSTPELSPEQKKEQEIVTTIEEGIQNPSTANLETIKKNLGALSYRKREDLAKKLEEAMKNEKVEETKKKLKDMHDIVSLNLLQQAGSTAMKGTDELRKAPAMTLVGVGIAGVLGYKVASWLQRVTAGPTALGRFLKFLGLATVAGLTLKYYANKADAKQVQGQAEKLNQDAEEIIRKANNGELDFDHPEVVSRELNLWNTKGEVLVDGKKIHIRPDPNSPEERILKLEGKTYRMVSAVVPSPIQNPFSTDKTTIEVGKPTEKILSVMRTGNELKITVTNPNPLGSPLQRYISDQAFKDLTQKLASNDAPILQIPLECYDDALGNQQRKTEKILLSLQKE